MSRLISRFSRKAAVVVAAALVAMWLPAPAMAQPAGNQMCGDGTTFTVTLPHVATGTGGHDTIEVPHGCSIYLVIASDYGRNREFNELLFYPLAKYVAEHNGYVHYSWWNNFLKPYMGGVLHSKALPTDPGMKTTIGMLPAVYGLDVPFGLPGGAEVYVNDLLTKIPRIGSLSQAMEQFLSVLMSNSVTVPTDQQFVSDAGFFIQAAHANNPNALVFLAGHGFGAHAIVKVAEDSKNKIDLLAPIDPIGTDSLPVGYRDLSEEHNPNPFIDEVGGTSAAYSNTAPHTRWRAVFDFKGYQTADCVRDGLFCKDFDNRLLFFNLHCIAPDPSAWQSTTPDIWTKRPFSCPGPLVDPGKRISFGANVGFLYHRYQQEWGPPVDYAFAYHYGFRSAVTKDLTGPNVQGPIVRGDVIFPSSPYYIGGGSTCQNGGPGCQPADGHDEIAGFRGEPTFNLGADVVLTLTSRGVQARDWPSDPVDGTNLRSSDTAQHSAERRQAMIEMASTTINVNDFDCDFDASIPGESFWAHSPCTPDDCLVCNDLVTIATHLLGADEAEVPPPAADTTAPSVLAAVDPEANANGWHQADVVVTLHASDNAGGSGVQAIQYSTAAGPTVEQGDVAQATVTDEGTTQLSFFATDNANNSGAPNQLELKVDKTLPLIEAVTGVLPNANGWFKTDVIVSFPASDVLSGLAAVTPDTLVELEGADQEIQGTATDNADNQASASVVLNIDKTAPTITFASKAPSANAAGWNAGNVTLVWNCADTLSGPGAASVTETVTADGAAQLVAGTCLDLAGNTASDTQGGINIDTTAPVITFATRTPANAAGWNRASVSVVWNCSDALSGPGSPSVMRSVSGDGAGQTATGTCVDLADNSASDTKGGFNIDSALPSVNITEPADGAVLLLNAQVASNYACSDSLSGVQSCAGPVGSGAPANTSSAGSKQFTVNASDVAGNTASATNTYSVQYGFSGFGNPIGPMPTRNVVNAGRTVPVKYVLQDANGRLISDVTTFVSLQSGAAACEATAPGVLAEETTAAGSTEIRWDPTSQQFVYNWKTDKAWAGSCRVLQLTLSDGTHRNALFQFK